METTMYLRCTVHEVANLFNKGINQYAQIRYYNHDGEDKAKIILRHSDKLEFKENATYSVRGLIERCKPSRKYRIVTFSYDSGEDDKADCYTLEQAKERAKEYIQDAYYESVKVFCKRKVVAEFSR